MNMTAISGLIKVYLLIYFPWMLFQTMMEMARAFALAVEAGRMAYLAGLGLTSRVAVASSPLTAFLDEEQARLDTM